MARVVKIEGVRGILRNLRKSKAKSARGLERGLTRAGLFLQRKSQEVVPIDTGALKGSAFTRKENSGLDTEVIVGYTQDYAIFVHEDLEARHAPGKIAKFLETPARQNNAELLSIIKSELGK